MQELHELLIHRGGGFVLHPMTHIVEFDASHETGKADAQLFFSQRIQLFQAIRLAHHEKSRLRDLRALPCGG